MKTLYFEAAGCYILHNDVESGRIRTAFTNRDGKKVYIELICGCKSLAIKKEDKSGKDMREKWIIKSEYGYMFCPAIISQMIPKSMIVWNPVCRVSGICILKR